MRLVGLAMSISAAPSGMRRLFRDPASRFLSFVDRAIKALPSESLAICAWTRRNL